ncbi:hypothetical protein DQ04_17481000 [Trypanosoma grayi]|uniref:hypothetical protein n=1 Tax=Trypanosoma grayi TaxID=71804 RepID=UPI0004F4B711|nr:hypothetical protein DQ04_17481000 [Trypanosoma grayi]KEG05897.1 hypothetical protein DQ04_17481000 [Trypanosoma grayi]
MLRSCVRLRGMESSTAFQGRQQHSSELKPRPLLKSMRERLANLVLECDRNATRPFSGSLGGGIFTLTGVALCALTFIHNVGRPVMNAYGETETNSERSGQKHIIESANR